MKPHLHLALVLLGCLLLVAPGCEPDLENPAPADMSLDASVDADSAADADVGQAADAGPWYYTTPCCVDGAITECRCKKGHYCEFGGFARCAPNEQGVACVYGPPTRCPTGSSWGDAGRGSSK